jgi:hypothetical protein
MGLQLGRKGQLNKAIHLSKCPVKAQSANSGEVSFCEQAAIPEVVVNYITVQVQISNAESEGHPAFLMLRREVMLFPST